MKQVDRLILRELVGPFVFGVAAFTSVFFAATYIKRLTDWIADGMSVMTAIHIVILVLPTIMFYTLPMSALLAVLMAMGRLSGDSEIVALYAGGVSLYRVAAPITVMGILVSAGSIALNETITPRAFLRYQQVEAEILRREAPQDTPFVVRDDDANILIFVKGGMDLKTNALRNVTITHFSSQGAPVAVLHAPKAEWAGVVDNSKKFRWRLHDGWWQSLGTPSGAVETFSGFQTREEDISQGPDQFGLMQRSTMKGTDQLSFAELRELVAYQREHPDRPQDQIRKLEVNMWNRLAFPLASLMFAMLATPLGIRRHRSTSSMGFALSVLVILVYWLLWSNTSSLATQGMVPPIVGAFAANVISVVCAIALVRRAAK